MMAFFTSLEVFKERNARILLVSQLLSQICDKIMSIGLVWFITQKFDQLFLPWYLFFGFLPHLLFFPWSASWINRIGLLKTVVGADIFRGAVFLALYFYTLGKPPEEILYPLFIGVFLVGIGSSFFNPAMMSLPPKLVSDKNIASLNTLLDLCFSLSHIFAAALSIWLLQVAEVQNIMLANSILFFFGAFYQSRIKIVPGPVSVGDAQTSATSLADPSQSKKISFTKNLSETWTVLQRYSVIKKLIFLFFILNLTMAPLFVFLPWYAKNVFDGSSSALAWLETGWAAGALTGGIILLLIQIKNHTHFLRFLYTMISGFGMILILFSINRKIAFGVALMSCLGILISVLNVNILTYFQKTLQEKELPFVMSMANLISTASIPISMMSAGFLMQKISVPQMAFYSGVLVFLLSIFFRQLSKNSEVISL